MPSNCGKKRLLYGSRAIHFGHRVISHDETNWVNISSRRDHAVIFVGVFLARTFVRSKDPRAFHFNYIIELP